MKIEKVEFILLLGDCDEETIVKLETGLDVKRFGDENGETYLQLYSDYENVDELLGLVKAFLDHDIPVVMRKCYEEVEE